MGNESWKTHKLKSVTDMQMGPTILQKELTTDGIPVYSAGNREEIWGYTTKKVKTFSKGTLVVSARGTIGSPRIPTSDEFTCTQTTIAMRANELVYNRFLCYYLQTVNWDDIVSGVAIPMLTISKLSTVDIQLPPFIEQQQIVEKLDAILPKVRQLKARLEKIPVLLKIFRQSVLSSACSGKLTEDWRIVNSSTKNWDVRELSDIAEVIFTGPFGTMLHKSDYIKGGIPVINPTNIINNIIEPDHKVTITADKALELARYILKENDIVLSRRGDLSKCGIVSEKEVGWLAGTGAFIVRVKMDPNFFRMAFQTPATQETINSSSIGSTMPNLNQGILSKLKVLCPSPEEQQEVVTRVDNLFALADSIEAKHKQATQLIEKIEQSVLAKAFHGELNEHKA